MDSKPSPRLLAAVAARNRAERVAKKARDELHAAILADLADGVRQADIVRATGYTRERVRLLARDEARRHGN